MPHSLTAALAIFALAGSTAASSGTFENNFAKAQANALTAPGAAYDKALQTAFEGMPEFAQKLADCLRDNPGSHDVRGYFLFFSPKDFQVVLEPRDEFTFCLSPALASPSLPVPPSVPYLNPFTFTTRR